VSKNRLIIAGLLFLAMLLVSFVGGPVGASILGRDMMGMFDIGLHAPDTLCGEEMFKLGGMPISNTMLAAWLSMIVLIGLFYIAARKPRLVPSGLQNLVEFIMEWLQNFINDMVGEKVGRKIFPVVATIFFFVLANGWMGLLPIFGPIGQHTEEGFIPLLRGGNTDLNFPLSLAIISAILVETWGFKTAGMPYLGKFFNFGNVLGGVGQVFRGKVRPGISRMVNGVIDVFAGLIELISELFRLISFTFRLFGNMFAGELLVMVALYLIPLVVVQLVYGLEFLFGFVQALIFAGLTTGFVAVAVASREHE
jgi:F-type H+-transporting ATPase subunit a